MNNSKTEAFENVKEQIGFCGIWCGSCVVGNGTLRELTRRYEEIIRSHGLEEWAPRDFDYAEFSKGLRSIQRAASCQGCLKGGGREDCEMRTCAVNKGINSCTECSDRRLCKHSELLEKMRSGALAAGLNVKAYHGEKKNILSEWITEIKSKWPSCILFRDD